MAILLQSHMARSNAGYAFAKLTRCLGRSRALASMLPSLLLSGMSMLTVTAIMCPIGNGAGKGVFGVWMEAWLISWPITFPLVYLFGLLLRRFAAFRCIVLL